MVTKKDIRMRKIPLGQTNTLLPEITLGSMTWGSQTSELDAYRQLDYATDRGIDWVDAAEMYPVNPILAETVGETEAIIGRWRAKTGGRDMKIATKVSGAGMKAVRDGAPISAATIEAAVEASLRRLQVECIDLYQFHWPNRGSYHFRQNWTYAPPVNKAEILRDMEVCLQAVDRLVAAGKIAHFGLSNETAWGLSQWLRLADAGVGPRVATIQNEYSLMARLFDTDLAEACALEQVTLLAFSPLATGLLTGKYQGNAIPEASRKTLNPTLGGRHQPRAYEAVDAYLSVAAKHGLDPVHMTVAWLQTRPFPVTALLGATTQDQLEHGLDATGLELTADVVADLDAVHRAHPMPF